MSQLLFPDSPSDGDIYAAPNGVTYTYDATIGFGVWRAASTAPLSVTSGSIAGGTALGAVLTYTPGVASGGVPSSTPPAYTYTQQWFRDGTPIGGATGTTYTIVAADQGTSLTVTITARDSNIPQNTATATTAPFAVPAANVLAISSAGTITGTAASGSTLTYSTGTATGGTPAYTYTWDWVRESDSLVLASDVPTYQLTGSEIGTRVYVTLTATDSVLATASANTASYPVPPNVITAAPFPNLPAALVAGPTQIPQIVSGTWNDGPQTNLTSTGCIEISLDGSTFTQGPLSIGNGATLYMQWALTGAICGDAPHGTTITGTLTNGTYTNSYSLTLDRNPAVTPTPVPSITGQALSTTATSSVVTISGTNAPAYLTYTPTTPGPSLAPLANLMVSINTLAYVAVPASGNTLKVPPGATLQFKGDVAGANSTAYTTTFNLGTTTLPWSVTTTAVVPTVTTPSITAPSNGASGLNPTLNSPAGLTVTGDGYADGPTPGASGGHGSSDWQIFANGLPNGYLSTNTVSLVTAPTPGTSGTLAYKNADSADPNPALAQNEVYGKIPQDNALAQGSPANTYPAFEWAASVNSVGLNGFNDWYISSKNELEILYYNLKPGTLSNNTASGTNVYAVPSRGFNYTTGTPAQTSLGLFQTGGSQAFSTGSNAYWSSSESSSFTTDALIQSFTDGAQSNVGKSNSSGRVRLIRRIPIASYTAAGSPAIGTYIATAGGFYAGQISTAGNGTADYALIVAPKVGGEYAATPGTNTVLSILNAAADGFAVGQQVKGSSSGATGIITAIDGTSVTVLQTSATNFTTSDKLEGNGTAVVNVTNNANLVSYFVPQASLTTSTPYFARVKYNSVNNPPVYSSAFSGWSSFTTASAFIPAIGAPFGGGYFAGQIRVPASGGTIYNLIVAPIEGDNSGPATGGALKGQYGGTTPTNIQWKTSTDAETGGNIAQAQNLAYGGTWTNTAGGTTTSGLGGLYPLFGWCKNSATGPNGGGGIGGFTDWYIPAKNELEVLYYYLKPNDTGTQPNSAASGSNPNAVAPEPISTNYTATNPAQTTVGIFQGTNAQAFSTANFYWSSSEYSSNTGNAWVQGFNNGLQANDNKVSNRYARAVRRVAA